MKVGFTIAILAMAALFVWSGVAEASGPNNRVRASAIAKPPTAANSLRAQNLRQRRALRQHYNALRRAQLRRLKRVGRRVCASGSVGAACRAAVMGGGVVDVKREEGTARIITSDGDIVTEGVIVPEGFQAGEPWEGTAPIDANLPSSGQAPTEITDTVRRLTCTDAAGRVVACPTH